ncbi:MAG: hypothetical protein KKI08_01265 [Armatimonadetes bacterium]|nr:hypothetical protein [Armatimonadota bacterium]
MADNQGQPQAAADTSDIASVLRGLQLGPSSGLRGEVSGLRDGTPLLSLVLAANIDGPVVRPLIDILRVMGPRDRLDVFLYGPGGITEIGWWIITLLREYACEFAAIVPFQAMSSMTHVALAADELVMSEISVLSSVDPMRMHPLLPRGPQGEALPFSVEDLKQCIRFVQEQVGSAGEADLRPILAALFEHVEPLAIGALERSYALARLITEKALQTRKLKLTSDEVKGIVAKLGGDYHSHQFIISRRCVEDDLGLPVTHMSSDLSEACWQLYLYYERYFSQRIPLAADNGATEVQLTGFMEFEGSRRALIDCFMSGQPQPLWRVWAEVAEDGHIVL